MRVPVCVRVVCCDACEREREGERKGREKRARARRRTVNKGTRLLRKQRTCCALRNLGLRSASILPLPALSDGSTDLLCQPTPTMSKPFKTLSDDFHISIAQTQDDFDLKALAVRYKGPSSDHLLCITPT